VIRSCEIRSRSTVLVLGGNGHRGSFRMRRVPESAIARFAFESASLPARPDYLGRTFGFPPGCSAMGSPANCCSLCPASARGYRSRVQVADKSLPADRAPPAFSTVTPSCRRSRLPDRAAALWVEAALIQADKSSLKYSFLEKHMTNDCAAFSASWKSNRPRSGLRADRLCLSQIGLPVESAQF